MARAPIIPARGLDPQIVRKLRRLRIAMRWRLAVEGLAALIVALAAAAVASLVVDYGLYLLTRQHMTVPQRLVIAAACLAGVAWCAWRLLLRPQMSRLTDHDLAMVVERRHPELADRLASALLFGRVGDPRAIGASAAMMELAARQANEMAGPLRFTDALRLDRAARFTSAAVMSLLLMLGLVALQRPVMRQWFARMVLLQDGRYPKSTHLTVEGGPVFRVARASPLAVTVLADAQKTVPEQVRFHLRFASAGEVEETVGPVAPGRRVFVKRFEVVNEPFEFRVSGGDDRTESMRVEVAEPPHLRQVIFTIDAPAYTHLPRRTLTSAQGVIHLPVGAVVTVSGTASKDLAEATILLDGAVAAGCTIGDGEGAAGSRRLRAISGRFVAAAPRPFRPSMSLRFAMKDTEGFTNAQAAQYTLMLSPDRPPQVQIALVGIGGQISARALIPMQVTSRDDYGIQRVDLEWHLLSAAEKRNRLGMVAFDPDQKEPKPFTYGLDLTKLPAGSVSEGESIRLLGIALDTLPQPDGPNSTISNPITLKVVPDEDLLAALVDSQRVLREQFRQAISMQIEARSRTNSASERARDAAAMNEAQQLAGESADMQQQITDRVAATAGRFEEILQQLANNRIGAEPDKQRLAVRVIAPLRQLSSGPMRKLSNDLLAARSRNEWAGFHEELARLAAAQDAARVQMEQVIAEMAKVESAQQLEHGLKLILDASQRVREMTAARRFATSQPTSRPVPK